MKNLLTASNFLLVQETRVEKECGIEKIGEHLSIIVGIELLPPLW